MSSWDRRSPAALAKLRDAAVREQVRDVVAPFSPFWRERFAEIGVKPASIAHARDLVKVPAVGERDVCPDGDPAKAARLVVQASETGYALHAPGPALRKAMWRRFLDVDAYRRQVEADTRATVFVFDGLGFQFPIASTRSDLDLLARAGARLWQVLGLGTSDLMVSAVPVEARTSHVALELAAMAAGSPSLFPGDSPDAVAATLGLVPATVLAARSEDAAGLVDELADIGAPVDSLTTLLLLGAPTTEERAHARQALEAAGIGGVAVLGVHAPSGGRVLWGECRQSAGGTSAGYHTYPDLDVVQAVDPESGEPAEADGPSELVLTQLGFRGSALLRWRTGDLIDTPIETARCPGCSRLVPRVPAALRRGALVSSYHARGRRPTTVDFRGVAGALLGRPDVSDWRAVLRRSIRDDSDELLVHVVPTEGSDLAGVVVAAARDLRTVAGTLPSQLIAATPDEIAALDRNDAADGTQRLTARMSVRR